ncbi:single-stranded DNA-binding protein [Mycolicibacterium porcinum]|uniref:Single-stranded DNA-binding protein n=1 Tax=Mycolicibacterium porcinum TaxID=39693 RepID=A0AAW5TA15_9MYCO|nr:single-stranded DNA-binding protein [Mycolicibacterium porcinum]MBX8691548.1 single-stranded DNA-binding protein [Mycobacterium sp. 20091114027_K0903767]OCB46585.1 single-stranded DNA-binding protein [Mycolicibacterium vulneris]MCV7391371.1 single-stranded DNA-binding protein [Mycolicibacterium porcinum]ORB41898.1 single-stranded DNA-binding protein [Mycolicibacterium porcinum]CDO32970.1 single stranded DNA-binding protein [Mycolicibacterium vulneris]
MFETPFTIVGNIITDPVRRRFGDQELYKFRVASNSRRRTPDGSWEHGNSLYVTVNCWGNLATGTSASLTKGDAVIVVGQVHTNEYEDKEGVRRSSLEVRASAVGPDLSRCTAKVAPLPKPSVAPAAEPEPVDSDTAETEPDEGDLPLSA